MAGLRCAAIDVPAIGYYRNRICPVLLGTPRFRRVHFCFGHCHAINPLTCSSCRRDHSGANDATQTFYTPPPPRDGCRVFETFAEHFRSRHAGGTSNRFRPRLKRSRCVCCAAIAARAVQDARTPAVCAPFSVVREYSNFFQEHCINVPQRKSLARKLNTIINENRPRCNSNLYY